MKENNFDIILEPIYYRAISKKIKIKSKYQSSISLEDLKKIETYEPSKKEIQSLSNQFSTFDNSIANKKLENTRSQILNFFDVSGINYSPIELDKMGLSETFSGSFIYIFLKYNLEQKYMKEKILSDLILTDEKVEKYGEKFLIEKGLLISQKNTQENFMFFIEKILTELQKELDLYLDEDNKKSNLEITKKYIKLIKKTLKRFKWDLKSKKVSYSQYLNNEIGRNHSSSEKISELKKITQKHISKIEQDINFSDGAIEELKKIEDELDKKIDEKDVKIKIKILMKNIISKTKIKIGYKSSIGDETYIEVSKKD